MGKHKSKKGLTFSQRALGDITYLFVQVRGKEEKGLRIFLASREGGPIDLTDAHMASIELVIPTLWKRIKDTAKQSNTTCVEIFIN